MNQKSEKKKKEVIETKEIDKRNKKQEVVIKEDEANR